MVREKKPYIRAHLGIVQETCENPYKNQPSAPTVGSKKKREKIFGTQ